MSKFMRYLIVLFILMLCGCESDDINNNVDTYYIKYSIICTHSYELTYRNADGQMITTTNFATTNFGGGCYEIKTTNNNFQAHAETYGAFNQTTELRIYVAKNKEDYFIVAHNNCKGTSSNPRPMIYVNYNLKDFE